LQLLPGLRAVEERGEGSSCASWVTETPESGRIQLRRPGGRAGTAAADAL